MQEKQDFYTLKGYQMQNDGALTAAMEDYLEMIYRVVQQTGAVRIQELAQRLHGKPSSASKMALNLKNGGYLEFEPYGTVAMTEKGMEPGA